MRVPRRHHATHARRFEAGAPSRAQLDQLREELERQPVATLLYGAHDENQNHAVILRDALTV